MSVKLLTEPRVSNNFLKSLSYEYALTEANGETIYRDAEVIEKKDAVAVLLYNDQEDEFSFVKQFRLPAYLNGVEDGYLLEACAGHIDEGESPVVAAKREVMEEMGITTDRIFPRGSFFVSPGYTTEKIHLFQAYHNSSDFVSGAGGGVAEEGERTEVVKIRASDTTWLMSDGKIQDMKTMLLLIDFLIRE